MYPSIGKTSPIPGKCYTDIPYGKIKPDMPVNNYACQFPFTYQGKEYHKCTNKDLTGKGVWCALEQWGTEAGHECELCWKNETYRWGNCIHGNCGKIVGEHYIIISTSKII